MVQPASGPGSSHALLRPRQQSGLRSKLAVLARIRARCSPNLSAHSNPTNSSSIHRSSQYERRAVVIHCPETVAIVTQIAAGHLPALQPRFRASLSPCCACSDPFAGLLQSKTKQPCAPSAETRPTAPSKASWRLNPRPPSPRYSLLTGCLAGQLALNLLCQTLVLEEVAR